ncbi:MAG: alkane 1-monooxygenase, partial [Flavobacteriales bacterium]
MMIRASLKYALAWTIPVCFFLGWNLGGAFAWTTLVFAFGVLPLLEFILPQQKKNVEESVRELWIRRYFFRGILHAAAITQCIAWVYFLYRVQHDALTLSELMGQVVAMGIMCGVFAINVAHELGHHTQRFDQMVARLLLATSLYMHFFIEHNKGHHRDVGTVNDPDTARLHEGVYRFWFRSIIQGYRVSWDIVAKERKRRGEAVWSFISEWFIYWWIQIALFASVALIFSTTVCIAACGAAAVGILLLETVNYIEHYGLARRKVSDFRYENVEPWHSWNSDHALGRSVLFELSRHSDHHWKPSKPYQVLDTMEDAAMLPAGYPAMMLLCLLPPVW